VPNAHTHRHGHTFCLVNKLLHVHKGLGNRQGLPLPTLELKTTKDYWSDSSLQVDAFHAK